MPIVIWACHCHERIRPEFDDGAITADGATIGTSMLMKRPAREYGWAPDSGSTDGLERKLIGAAIVDVLFIDPPAPGIRPCFGCPNCTADGYQEIHEWPAETDHASGQRH